VDIARDECRIQPDHLLAVDLVAQYWIGRRQLRHLPTQLAAQVEALFTQRASLGFFDNEVLVRR